MFLMERQEEICSLLELEGRVTVVELAKRFGVSENCIRTDLMTLAGQGKCHRVYGGAFAASSPVVRDLSTKLASDQEGKAEMASIAYDLIQDGEIIFLDISTTNVLLAKLLATGNKSCTVVSNMIDVSVEASSNPSVHVIGIGGTLSPLSHGFIGPMTVAALVPMRFDAAFMGTNAVDITNGAVMTAGVEDALVKQQVLGHTKRNYLLVDKRKYTAEGAYQYAEIRQFLAVITDADDPGCIDGLEKSGVEVLKK